MQPPSYDSSGKIRRTVAIAYAAKSTEDRHGSIPTQLADCRAMAEREGWELVAEYQDEGFSAFRGNRGPGLADAREHAVRLAIEHGRCVLVAQHSDRVARGGGDAPGAAEHLAEVYFWASRNGVELRSVQDDGNLTNPLLAFVIGQRNHEDSRRKSEATKSGIRRRVVERGLRNGGQRPYGYRFEYGGLVPVSHEAEVVCRIFSEVAAGRSQREIAVGLNADGISTARGRGWSQTRISQMLDNPLYIGKLRSNDEVFDGKHEPLLPTELWVVVQGLLAGRRASVGKGRGRRPKSGHLFTNGLLRCGTCGEAMLPRSEGKPVYRCYGALSGRAECGQAPVPQEAIDAAAFDFLAKAALDVEATREQLAEAADRKLAETRALLHEAEQEAQRADERMARVRRDYQDGALDADDWRDQREQLASEQEGARAEVERLRHHEHAIAEIGVLRDAEQEVLDRLGSLRAAVVGEVRDDQGIAAVRATLIRFFDRFELMPCYFVRTLGEAASVDLAVGGDYYLEPYVKPHLIEGYAVQGHEVWPVLRRAPLYMEETNTASRR